MSIIGSVFGAMFGGGAKPVPPPSPKVAAPSIIKARGDYSLVDEAHAKVVQARLIDLGYLEPPVDGKWGGSSAWALGALGSDNHERDLATTYDAGSTLPASVQGMIADAKQLPLHINDSEFLSQVVRGMVATGANISRHQTCRNIVAAEGYDLSGVRNDDRRNSFNDVKMVFHLDGFGRPVLDGAFVATTTPGHRWSRQPMHPDGAFNIKPGWQKAWRLGEYHGRALRQVGMLEGYRDRERASVRDLRYPVRGDGFGVHHHQGYNLPRDDMKNASAGCQVIRSTTDHEKFIGLALQDARYKANHGYVFSATVLEQEQVPK